MAVRSHEPLLSRRALLAAGVGSVAVAAGCTSSPPKRVEDPDAAALEAARLRERTLLATYAEGSEGHAVHLDHLRALGGATPTAGAGPTTPPPSPSPTGTTESSSVAPLMAAARAARNGSTAALLASIAASHAVIADVRPR